MFLLEDNFMAQVGNLRQQREIGYGTSGEDNVKAQVANLRQHRQTCASKRKIRCGTS